MQKSCESQNHLKTEAPSKLIEKKYPLNFCIFPLRTLCSVYARIFQLLPKVSLLKRQNFLIPRSQHRQILIVLSGILIALIELAPLEENMNPLLFSDQRKFLIIFLSYQFSQIFRFSRITVTVVLTLQ